MWTILTHYTGRLFEQNTDSIGTKKNKQIIPHDPENLLLWQKTPSFTQSSRLQHGKMIFTNYTWDRQLISKIYKEVQELEIMKTLNTEFENVDIQVADKDL